MNKCPYCQHCLWRWQGSVFTLHAVCLEIFCKGYVHGVTTASEQAAKIMLEVQRKLAPTEKRETLQ